MSSTNSATDATVRRLHTPVCVGRACRLTPPPPLAGCAADATAPRYRACRTRPKASRNGRRRRLQWEPDLLKRRRGLLSRLGVTLIASLVVTALVAPGAGAHDGVKTAEGHAAEDAVAHTAAQERALDAHTRASQRPTRGEPLPRSPRHLRTWASGVRSSTGRLSACTSRCCRTARSSPTTRSATTRPRRTRCTTTRARPCGIRRRASIRRSTSTPTSTSSAAAWRISPTAGCSWPEATRTRRSTASSRLTSSIPGRTCGASARTWRRGRWYPSVTPLNNGEMLITSGRVNTPEVRTLAGGLRALSTASLGLPLYPWMDVAPDGRAFYSGPDQTMRMLNPAGTGTWETLGQRDTLNRDYGGHALFDVGKILVAGGGGPRRRTRGSSTSTGAPQVSPTAPMAFGRRQHNLTVLADGTVLATGGLSSSGRSSISARASTRPNSGTPPRASGGPWPRCRSRASTTRPRCCCPTGASSPPAAGSAALATRSAISPRTPRSSRRPTSSRPTARSRRARPSTPRRRPRATARRWRSRPGDPASIRKVALVRLGAVTHSNNMEQRYIPLSFTAGATSITATAPANANIAPPGPLHALHHRCERRAFRGPHGQRPGRLAAGRRADAAGGRRDASPRRRR